MISPRAWMMGTLALAALSAALGCSSSSAEKPKPAPPAEKERTAASSAEPPRPATPPERTDLGRVVARVNGEPIYEKELQSGLPDNMFGLGMDKAREDRLTRLIETRLLQQFVKAQKVTVKDEEVEKEVTTLRNAPPSMGCRCCYYQSLDDFLQQNCLTLDDLRADIRNGLALTRHVEVLWQKAYLTEPARQKLVKSKEGDIRGRYRKVWHIYFMSQPVNGRAMEDEAMELTRKAKERADAASKRLAKGDRFEDLVKELSEDKRTAEQGGLVGLVDTEYPLFGTIMPSEIEKLKAGEVSPPLQSAVGYHLIKWGAISDPEVLDLLKNEFCQKAEGELLRSLPAAARIERPKKPTGADQPKE